MPRRLNTPGITYMIWNMSSSSPRKILRLRLIGTDGEFGEEEGRTYLLSREIGNELVKRAYLPDLEVRTPELHDEIAVTSWGGNA